MCVDVCLIKVFRGIISFCALVVIIWKAKESLALFLFQSYGDKSYGDNPSLIVVATFVTSYRELYLSRDRND